MKGATLVINQVISLEIVVQDEEIVEIQDQDLPHIIVDIVEIPDHDHHVVILATEEITGEDRPPQEVEEIVEIDVTEEIEVDLDHQLDVSEIAYQ
jgi:mitochondrial fission protein ELM1